MFEEKVCFAPYTSFSSQAGHMVSFPNCPFEPFHLDSICHAQQSTNDRADWSRGFSPDCRQRKQSTGSEGKPGQLHRLNCSCKSPCEGHFAILFFHSASTSLFCHPQLRSDSLCPPGLPRSELSWPGRSVDVQQRLPRQATNMRSDFVVRQ